MNKIVIALDAMGGDNAPKAMCLGALQAVKAMPEIEILLFGRMDDMRACLPEEHERLHLMAASEVIGMEESPMMAIRKKADSSMVRAMLAVKEGQAQAMVSAGSTGAVLVGGMTRIGRVRGVERPALAPVIPGRQKPFLLLDSGANVDCQPQFLRCFGLMGSVYMQKVYGVENPDVALLNIGVEEEKGSTLYKEAYRLMREQQVYNFVGNVESRDVAEGVVDVVVADGFDGNIVLKYTEGMSSTIMKLLKESINTNLRSKLGGLLLKPALKQFKRRFDYKVHGGAPLLGLNGAVIKAHGSSNEEAVVSAIKQAVRMVEGNVCEIIRTEMERISAQPE